MGMIHCVPSLVGANKMLQRNGPVDAPYQPEMANQGRDTHL
jgi:hypothetical protein